MAFKDWLQQAKSRATKAAGKQSEDTLTVDDLINLERYEEALSELKEKLRRRPQEHHTRSKLADLLMRVGRRSEAVDEFLAVSDGYERDGFYKKASALVAKVQRLLPNDDRVRAKAERLKRMTRQDHLRKLVVDNLPQTQSMKVEQLWTEMVQSELLGRLSEEQLKRILPNVQVRELDAEEEYVAAGVRKDELLWVVGGQLAARVVLPNGSSTDIRSFAAGSVVGERALFKREPWPAIYVASVRTTILVLDREALERSLIGEENPRAFLEALRADANDEAVVSSIAAMGHHREEP